MDDTISCCESDDLHPAGTTADIVVFSSVVLAGTNLIGILSKWCPLSKLAPEGHLCCELLARPLVKAVALIEGRAVQVKGHSFVGVTGVFHSV